MLLQAIAAVVAKIASASTVAQIAAGLGVAVAGVTGAGAAGVLPGPVQDGVAGAIEAVTPFHVPDSADGRGSGVDDRHPAVETGSLEPEHSAGASPSEIPVVPAPVTPSVSHETEAENEVEAGDDDGIHQHRGARTGTELGTPGPSSATRTAAPTPVVHDSPEAEDHDTDDHDTDTDDHDTDDHDTESHDTGDDRGSHGGNSSGDSSGHGTSSGRGGSSDRSDD